MTSLEHLPPDQRATLTLLLGRGKSCEEVASLLNIEPRAVHDRAHAALAVLAPRLARQLDPQSRERIGEYLLGRQDEQTAAQTKAQLAASAPQREWARAVALQLVQLTAGPLPHIPEATPERASRRGGAIVLAAIAVLIVAVIVVVLTTGGSGNRTANQSASTRTDAARTEGGTGKQRHHKASGRKGKKAGGASGQARKIESQMNLTAAESGSSAAGVLLVVSENGQKGLLLDAEHLPPTEKFVYYLWLVDSTGKAKPYAIVAPSVPATGKSKERMIAVTLLPSTASSYDKVELTKQTEANPTTPSSEAVLDGTFSLG